MTKNQKLKQHDAFEAWCMDVAGYDLDELATNEDERYVDETVDTLWTGWLARVEWTEQASRENEAHGK
jgi:hypothetical protein